jgi:hypothetical protein
MHRTESVYVRGGDGKRGPRALCVFQFDSDRVGNVFLESEKCCYAPDSVGVCKGLCQKARYLQSMEATSDTEVDGLCPLLHVPDAPRLLLLQSNADAALDVSEVFMLQLFAKYHWSDCSHCAVRALAVIHGHLQGVLVAEWVCKHCNLTWISHGCQSWIGTAQSPCVVCQ